MQVFQQRQAQRWPSLLWQAAHRLLSALLALPQSTAAAEAQWLPA
jgi:hypothetical protein